MNTKIKTEYLSFLEGLSAEKEAEHRRLSSAGAADEARLVKIEANILGVFRDTFFALEKAPEFPEKYTESFDKISKNWSDRLRFAQSYGDFETEAVERHKIAVCDLLKEKFAELWGG